MGRLKTFGKYILMIVAFYVFSTIVSAGFIRGTYADMGGKVYQGGNLSVYVDEAKSSFVNGHIKGNITNNSNENITSKYVKIEFISQKGNNILNKYIKIDELKAGETKNFTINFEAENIKTFNISISDEYVDEESNLHIINLEDAENEEIKNISIFLAVVILLKYVIL